MSDEREREGMRDATLLDLDALVALERACFPPAHAYGREQYVYALGPAKAVNLVLEEERSIVAYVGAFYHRAHRAGHVITLNVHPRARGQGHGRALMGACEEALRKLGMDRVALEVNVDNEPAIRLYGRLGYERIGKIAEYYSGYPNNDAFAYEKTL